METKNKSIKMELVPSFNILVFLLFFLLKINNVINWSWWWVTSPIWIPLALALIGIIFLFLTAVLLLIIGKALRM
jgi:hypothetical protein